MNRIFLVGDSILKGIVYDEDSGKYRFSDRMRLGTLEASGLEVINLSRMGATVGKGYKTLTQRLSGDLTGDTVILGFGGNDCSYNWQKVSEKDCEGILPLTPVSEFEQTYGKCIGYARSLGAAVTCVSLVPIDDVKYMSWISRGRSRENILSWLGDPSMLYRWHESYNRSVCRVCYHNNCDLIDVRAPFLSAHDYKDLMCADGIHPTDRGYALVEEKIVSAVSKASPVCCTA